MLAAGTVVASLLLLPSARPLGIDSAEADACESESRSSSSVDVHSQDNKSHDAQVARCSSRTAATAAPHPSLLLLPPMLHASIAGASFALGDLLLAHIVCQA